MRRAGVVIGAAALLCLLFSWWTCGAGGGATDPNAASRASHSDPPVQAEDPYARAPGYDPEWKRPARPSPNALTPPSSTPSPPHSAAPGPAPSDADPLNGEFDLQQATASLPPGQQLLAQLDTRLGQLSCELWPDRAPNTVANFVGLANGTRPWLSERGWQRQPAYDGTLFHRVAAQSGIRGGREGSVALSAPGYVIADEAWPGMLHDAAGLLCAVGAGPDRVGMEFLITTRAMPQLDNARAGGAAFTVFGRCGPLDLIERIATAEATHGRPKQPISIERLRVVRP